MKWNRKLDFYCPICGRLMKNVTEFCDTDYPNERSCVIECEDCEIQSTVLMNPLGYDE